ncbi:MAG: glutamine--fructose-6-phosphate transaminase (isomerizing) [Microbacteriaceae bacterium]
MCGIVGYVGERSTLDVLLSGLGRLEYRGYDSAGIALVSDDGALSVRKKAGKLAILAEDLETHPIQDSHTGIGHTRWATHGGPTDTNAHPHLADEGRLAVIHNGIIDNYAVLRDELLADGFTFESETDTEIAAALIGREYHRTKSLVEAFKVVVNRLHGTFTLLAVHQDNPDLIVAARRDSPLIIGLGEGENFLGSDVAAFVDYTKRAIAVEQDQIVAITPTTIEIIDFEGNPVTPVEYEVNWDSAAADKGGWDWYMAKEIHEQPEAVSNTLLGRHDGSVVRIPELETFKDTLLAIDRVQIIACGTASYAGMVAKYAIERWAKLPVDVDLAHEFRYRQPFLNDRTLVLSISQSGETMDLLKAVQYAKAHGAKTLSVCNTQGATIPRESDAVVYTHAGPEVAVASTKAFTAQITALYLFGLELAQIRGTMTPEEVKVQLDELVSMPEKMKKTLEIRAEVKELAGWMADTSSVLYLGRHVGYPIALEAALKLKELAYIHAEGFAAGELKHGPIALIEPGQAVFVMVPSPKDPDSLHQKVVSNIQEIRARGAMVFSVAEAGDSSVLPYSQQVLRIPQTTQLFEAFLQVIPLQLFALELSSVKGLDVDQPRNLAKSVTVE